MNYRKYSVKAIGLLLAMLMIVGSIRPVAAQQTEIDLNEELFESLTDEDKENIISELNLDIPKERFIGINFQGELVARPIRLTEQPTTVCVKEGPSGDFMDYVEVSCDQPLLIQKLYTENCGTYDDMAHLTVTASKDASHEIHSEHLFSVDVTINWENEYLFGSVGGSLSLGYQYATGKSDTFTTSTSWDQSVDVVVPPRQRLEIDFVAFKKKVSQKFEQEFIAMGTAKPVIRPEEEEEIIVGVYTVEEYPPPLPTHLYYYDDGENVIDLRPEKFPHELNYINLVSGKRVLIELYGSYTQNMYDRPDNHRLPPTNAQPRMLVSKTLMPGDNRLSGDWCMWGEYCKNWGRRLSQWYDTVSMRVIDLNRPHVCVGMKMSSPSSPYRRCFNVGQDATDLADFNYKNAPVDGIQPFQEIQVHGVKATLYSEPAYNGHSKTFTKSHVLGTYDRFASIKIEAADTEDVFSIQDYLSPEQRTTTIHGTYTKVDYAEGHFRRNTSTRMTYYQCCTERGFSGTESIDCMEENWANTMDSFVVYVKTREDGGQGIIYQNGIRCGDDCTIAVPLADLPVLWKLEAKPLANSVFARWESETGVELNGKHKPLPGDTIYAVFEPAAPPVP